MNLVQKINKPICITDLCPGEVFREGNLTANLYMKTNEIYDEDSHYFNCVDLNEGSLYYCCSSMVYCVEGAFIEGYHNEKKG